MDVVAYIFIFGDFKKNKTFLETKRLQFSSGVLFRNVLRTSRVLRLADSLIFLIIFVHGIISNSNFHRKYLGRSEQRRTVFLSLCIFPTKFLNINLTVRAVCNNLMN